MSVSRVRVPAETTNHIHPHNCRQFNSHMCQTRRKSTELNPQPQCRPTSVITERKCHPVLIHCCPFLLNRHSFYVCLANRVFDFAFWLTLSLSQPNTPAANVTTSIARRLPAALWSRSSVKFAHNKLAAALRCYYHANPATRNWSMRQMKKLKIFVLFVIGPWNLPQQVSNLLTDEQGCLRNFKTQRAAL